MCRNDFVKLPTDMDRNHAATNLNDSRNKAVSPFHSLLLNYIYSVMHVTPRTIDPSMPFVFLNTKSFQAYSTFSVFLEAICGPQSADRYQLATYLLSIAHELKRRIDVKKV